MLIAGLAIGCARPVEKPSPKKQEEKVQIKQLKPEEYPVPEKLKEVLPGLLNDKIRIWREISPTINLVAYIENYSLEKAIKLCAHAFMVLLEKPEFKKDIQFWIIQIQPRERENPEILVWGVRPSEAEEYKQTGDLEKFFVNSEYVLINDMIIEKGNERLKHFPKTLKKQSQQPSQPSK